MFPALDSLILSSYGTVSWPSLLREAAYLLVVYDVVGALMMMPPAACVSGTSRDPTCLRCRSPGPARGTDHQLFMTDLTLRPLQLRAAAGDPSRTLIPPTQGGLP